MGELFCGPGGLGLAAQLATQDFQDKVFGIEHAWATDKDPAACNTYQNWFFPTDPDRVVNADISEEGLFARLKEKSQVDAMSFGFPCNDFSIVGERKGTNGDYGPLYSYCVKALDTFNPIWFLAENVRGLHQANNADTFQIILRELALSGKGYKLYPHLYKFEEYGVPQARHRIIIVGIREDQECVFHVPSTAPFKDRDVSCRTALEKPLDSATANQEPTRQSATVISRLKSTNPGENAFTADLPDHLKLNISGATLSQIYKRLDPKKPSYTITGSGGGGTHVYHWEEPRALTNRERARLQTFPDKFTFLGKKEQVRRQIGMAVPPEGASVIFTAILKTFAGIEYDFIPQNIPAPPKQTETQEVLSFVSSGASLNGGG